MRNSYEVSDLPGLQKALEGFRMFYNVVGNCRMHFFIQEGFRKLQDAFLRFLKVSGTFRNLYKVSDQPGTSVRGL